MIFFELYKAFHDGDRKTKTPAAKIYLDLTANERQVYDTLLAAWNRYGRDTFNFSNKQLEEETALSRKTAVRAVDELVRLGLITRLLGSGRNRRTTYKMMPIPPYTGEIMKRRTKSRKVVNPATFNTEAKGGKNVPEKEGDLADKGGKSYHIKVVNPATHNREYNTESKTEKFSPPTGTLGRAPALPPKGENTLAFVSKKKSKKFIPPTLDEVKKYCGETKVDGYTLDKYFDPELFHSYYESVGWKKVKDWRAKARSWPKNNVNTDYFGGEHWRERRKMRLAGGASGPQPHYLDANPDDERARAVRESLQRSREETERRRKERESAAKDTVVGEPRSNGFIKTEAGEAEFERVVAKYGDSMTKRSKV